jgi:hypothetical protein
VENVDFEQLRHLRHGLAVPELIRGRDIQLNKRVPLSLRAGGVA